MSETAQAITTASPMLDVAPTATDVWSPWSSAVEAAMQCTPILSTVLQQFWGVPVAAQFLGISDKTHYYWRLDDFHVSQVALPVARSEDDEHLSHGETPIALLRLSDIACSLLLERVLGASELGHTFNFRQMSPLEASILNEFSRDILSCVHKNLIQKPRRTLSGDVLHLIWLVHLQETAEKAQAASTGTLKGAIEDPALGKIVLSLPVEALQMVVSMPARPEPIGDTFFFHVQATAQIALGQTRMALTDIDQLEVEDVVVLEDSQADTMCLIDPATQSRLPFQAEIRQRAQISMPYTQELDMMDTSSQSQSVRQNLWDNLMIDVSAEFAPIKLPLKHLKQMSEGLVVEMGDLIHNQVCLQVEGKTLAWGELIIVGDKFGVRVSKIEASERDNAEQPSTGMIPVASSAQAAPTQQAAPQAPPSGEAADAPQDEAAPGTEEAALDNFLNEDFDDAFDDEEDW